MPQHAGVASGVNNAVARAAGLIAVAALPAVAGLSGDSYTDPAQFNSGFRVALAVAAGLLVLGAAVAAADDPQRRARGGAGRPVRRPARRAARGQPGQGHRCRGWRTGEAVPSHHCDIEGPPLCGDPAPQPAGPRKR